MLRTIPLRLAPVPGEGLDSWLSSYAHLLGCSVPEVLESAGLDVAGLDRRAMTIAMGQGLDLSRLAVVAGLKAADLGRLISPLREYRRQSYNRLARRPGVDLSRVLAYSRFCPGCLEENGGRWLAAWRIAWGPACPRHGTYLLARCSECGSTQRQRPLRMEHTVPALNTCTAQYKGGSGRGTRLCSQDLTKIDASEAHPEIVALSDACHALLEADAHAAMDLDLLSDLTMLWVGSIQGEVLRIPRIIDQPAELGEHLRPAAAALLDPAEKRLRQLADPGDQPRPQPLPLGWNNASDRLVSLSVAVRSAQMRPTDLLRWQAATEGRRPSHGLRELAEARVRMPTTLWRPWALRLLPRQLPSSSIFPKLAAKLLLVPGTRLTLTQVLADTSIRQTELTRVMGQLLEDPSSDLLLRSLTLLAQAIRERPVPIDYARRRQFADARGLITDADWTAICRDVFGPVPTRTSRRHAELWLWEELTGADSSEAPARFALTNTRIHRYYSSFLVAEPPALFERLRQHATAWLRRNRIEGEPVSWHPELTEWSDLDGVPGIVPESAEAGEVRAQCRTGVALSEVAAARGLSLQHIRLLLRHSDTQPQDGRHPAVDPIALAKTLLVDRRRSLREAAREMGVGRNTARKLAQEAGVDLASPARRSRWVIDSAWLRNQYVEEGRPLRDIAAEVGCSVGVLKRVARENGIELRPRGGSSHRSRTVVDHSAPPLVGRLLKEGPSTWVANFQVLANSPTTSAAARRLGVSPAALSRQTASLEATLGAPLLVRSNHQHEPAQLTLLGTALQVEADQHYGSKGGSEPEPLRSALRVFRAEERLNRFVLASRHSSLAIAAHVLGTEPGTLRASLNNYQEAVGVDLWVPASSNRPVELTATGRDLVRQGAKHGALRRR